MTANNNSENDEARRPLTPEAQDSATRLGNTRGTTHRRMPRALHRKSWMTMASSQRGHDAGSDSRSERTSPIPRRTPTDWQRAVSVLANQWRTVVGFTVILVAVV